MIHKNVFNLKKKKKEVRKRYNKQEEGKEMYTPSDV